MTAIGEFGRDSVRDPRSVPVNAYGWFRRWFRTLFRVRGGGLYALGYVVTFAWLEVTSLFGDLLEADSVSGFVSGQAVEFAFRFLSESIQNMVLAFVWPVQVLRFSPPYGVLFLAAMFLVFGRFVKPHLERWLFGDESADTQDPDTGGADENAVKASTRGHDLRG